MKRANLKRVDHGLIASNLMDDNDYFSDSYHIKAIYFDDEDEYLESYNFNQDEYYSKIIKKSNDTDELMIINQNLEQMYNQYVTEYSILQKYKHMLHTVQFKKNVVLDKSTRMALKHRPTSRQYDIYKDMIASHHNFISTENKVQDEHNFCRTFF